MAYNMESVLGIPSKSYDYMNELGMNAYVLGLLIVVIFVYYVFFSRLATNTLTGQKSGYGKALEIGLWAVFLVLVVINGLQYFFHINFTTEFASLFSANPQFNLKIKDHVNYDGAIGAANSTVGVGGEIGARGSGSGSGSGGGGGGGGGGALTDVIADAKSTIDSSDSKKKGKKKENGKKGVEMSGDTGVFHIPANNYTYDESQKVCKAYGGRLATYNEIEEAYEDSADWCSYGWSDKQMVLYPTQKDRWERLQEIKGHENDCGRPGINGGYIDNPNARFGINCYGKRPKATKEDKARMKNTVIYPKTQEEIQFEKDVGAWKKKIPSIEVAPFNPKQWSS